MRLRVSSIIKIILDKREGNQIGGRGEGQEKIFKTLLKERGWGCSCNFISSLEMVCRRYGVSF